jgi:hypothetical protein
LLFDSKVDFGYCAYMEINSLDITIKSKPTEIGISMKDIKVFSKTNAIFR